MTRPGTVLVEARKRKRWVRLARKRTRGRRFRIAFSLPDRVRRTRVRAVLFRGKRRLATSIARPVRVKDGRPTRSAAGRVYWGAWIGPQLTGTAAPFDMRAVSKLQQMVGKSLSMVQFASPFADCSTFPCDYYEFPRTHFGAIRGSGAIPFLSWSSASIPNGVDQPNFQLSDVIAGAHDDYIRSFASQAESWGHPFFLRFNWEMNGDWFPWGEGVNGNRPGEFVAAWRHVHDIFTSVGATNATWVWCPYVDPTTSPSAFYPGDDYVDWTCLDGYNWGTNPALPVGWRGFDTLFSFAYQKVEEIAPGKPMVIGETASTEWGGSKAEWIREMFDSLRLDFPNVRGLLWFEQSGNDMDWPLETSESALHAFKTGIADSRYAANSFGHISANPIPPP